MSNITSRLNFTRTLGSAVMLGIMLFLSVPAATYAADTIIDQPGPGASVSNGWGVLYTTSAYKGRTAKTRNKSAWGTFKFGSLQSGKYDVYLYWPKWSGKVPDTAVPVVIKHSSGTQTVTVNQQQNGGQWNKLGRWTLDNTGYLTITNRGLGLSYFDAVKLVPSLGTPPQGPALSLTANPVQVSTGGAATLSWASQQTKSCTASGGWSGSKGTSGSETANDITSSQTYNLTCAGTTKNGTTKNVSATVKVAVISTPPPPPPPPPVPNGSLSGPGNCAEARSTSNVVFCQDFDGSALGDYSVSDLKSDFPGTTGFISGPTGAPNGTGGGRATIVSGVDAISGNSLRAKYPKNSLGTHTGMHFWPPIGENLDEAYIGLWIRFDPAFPKIKGGKIPGLTGGTDDNGKVSPCCGRDMKKGLGFSNRMMFVGGQKFVNYMYWIDNPNHPQANGNTYGGPQGGIASWVPGKWYFLEQHVKLNTPAGASNGLFETWVNGVKASTIPNTRIRGPGSNFSISHIQFETYLGGNESSWWSPEDVFTFFDVVVVSRNRIGGPGGG